MFAPKKNKKDDDPDDDVVTLFSTKISETAQKKSFLFHFLNIIGLVQIIKTSPVEVRTEK